MGLMTMRRKRRRTTPMTTMMTTTTRRKPRSRTRRPRTRRSSEPLDEDCRKYCGNVQEQKSLRFGFVASNDNIGVCLFVLRFAYTNEQTKLVRGFYCSTLCSEFHVSFT